MFELMRTGELHPIWFGLVFQGVVLGALCYMLAKSKNRNKLVASLAGFIPMLNYLAILYYVVAPKLKTE